MTRRQAAILSFLETYLRDNDGHSPSMEEIREALGIKSKSTVYYNVLALAAHGQIIWEPHLARTIRIVKQERQEVNNPMAEEYWAGVERGG